MLAPTVAGCSQQPVLPAGHRPLVVRLQSALQAAAIQGIHGEAGPSTFPAGQGGRAIPRAFTPPMTPTWETSLSAGSSPTMGAWPGRFVLCRLVLHVCHAAGRSYLIGLAS